MRTLLMILGTAAGWAGPGIPDPIAASSVQEEPHERPKTESDPGRKIPQEPENPGRGDDQWYGIPNVRPGGDLLQPLLDLLRHPSELLDFRPRKISPWVPDRETLEFLRKPR